MVDLVSEMVMRKSLEIKKLQVEVEELRQQLDERNKTDKSIQNSLNSYKEELEKTEKSYRRLKEEKRELLREKENLKNLLSRSTQELRDSKNRCKNSIEELNKFRAEVELNFISQADHEQIMRKSRDYVKGLEREIQLFRDEFANNLTAMDETGM